MTDQLLNPQNAATVWQRSAFPKTPGGSTIWVEATPVPAGRQNGSEDTLTSAAARALPSQPLTPLVIRDTFDLSTPSPPPATQRPPRALLQAQEGVSVVGRGEQMLTEGGMIEGALPSGAHDSQARASVAALPPVSPAGAGSIDDARLSPSPINVSWDTTAESISPSVRAAAGRARAGNAPGATGGLPTTAAANVNTGVHAAEPRVITPAVTAILAGGAAAAPNPDDDGPVPDADAAAFGRRTSVPSPGRPDTAALVLSGEGDVLLVEATGEPMYDGLAGTKTTTRAQWNVVGEDLEEDYFRFFTTPPASMEAAQRARGDVDANGDAYVGRQPVRDGELTSRLHPLNAPRTACKRGWTGTPDPEDKLRALRRPRPAGSTPTMRSGVLPSNEPGEVSNPWADENVAAMERDGEGRVDLRFVPVASSTPSMLAVPRPVMTSRRRMPSQPAPILNPTMSLTMPRPAALFNGNPLSLPPGQDGSEERTHAQVPAPMLSEPEPLMDVDEAPERHVCTDRSALGKGKGKARATSEEIDQLYEETNEEQAGQHVQDGWDLEQLDEARRASLAQAARVSTRGPVYEGHGRYGGQTEGAGSSRVGLEPNRERSRVTHENLPTVREDLTSYGYGNEYFRSRGPAPYVYDSTAHHGYGEADRSVPYPRHASRARSEYIPAPNTRAADFIASRAAPQRQSDGSRHSVLHAPDAAYAMDASVRARTHDVRDFPAHPDERFQEDGERDEYSVDDRRHGRRELHDGGEWDHGREDTWENGQIDEHGGSLPMALWGSATQEDDTPTPPPEGGFPPIYHDDPESHLRGMALEWLKEVWNDPPSTDVLVHVYNYRYSEDDVLNRRVAAALRSALERITGESGFDVVPPEPEEGASRRARDLPTLWAIRGLTPNGTAAAVSRGVWSYQSISFFASPRAATPQNWLFALEGFLEGNALKIRAAVLRVLQEESMERWLAEMLRAHPAYEGRSTRRAMSELLSSLRVDITQLGNGNYVANVFMRAPTRRDIEASRSVPAASGILRSALGAPVFPTQPTSVRSRGFEVGMARNPALESSASEGYARPQWARTPRHGTEADNASGEAKEDAIPRGDMHARTRQGTDGITGAGAMGATTGTSEETEDFLPRETAEVEGEGMVDTVAAAAATSWKADDPTTTRHSALKQLAQEQATQKRRLLTTCGIPSCSLESLSPSCLLRSAHAQPLTLR
ncbi:hypothetical protein K466DRAFT_569670 [Polyporus arcularius HHB13444]|uniref:Uncharacterized protein n=1 Tax=Polyporus arcularius HHB13444 TaxID=1314778 RepID=A0A5C3NTT9_9APHY|nr:hypothetical protein K466DRAFT_569670 [Polyporus arcularius HHB13444]